MKATLALVFCCVLGTAHADLTSGLVAHYLLKGNLSDATGNGRSLTNNGALPTIDRFGQSGFAYQFDGGSNILVQATDSDPLVLRTNFTLSCWAKFPGFTAQNYSLVRKDGDANLIIVNSQCYVETFLNGQEIRAFAGSPPIGTWCMITATWDGTNFAQYLNGQKQVSAQDSFARIVPDAPIALGGSLIYLDHLKGALDDVRIYNRVLSLQEVQDLYALESGPRVSFGKAFTIDFSNLNIGSNYVLQASPDLTTWRNYDVPFTATAAKFTNSTYLGIDNCNKLFFRLQAVP